MIPLLAVLSLAATSPSATSPSAPSLSAEEVRRLPAAEARQGVVAAADAVYAIGNREIGRYAKADGKLLARFAGDAGHFPHMNSCIVHRRELVCAASSFPAVPMWSRVERFDARTLAHLGSREIADAPGSLTWLDWHGGAWWAAFANYDGRGGTPGRDHRETVVVRYDRAFHEIARWHFPNSILDRFAPMSASGGAWGPDGLLYVSGHDRPELYAMRAPAGGGVLELVATIAMPTNGQAIGWDPKDRRILWSITRQGSELVASRIPVVAGR